MADRTGIEWTDATWNPIRGCSRVSDGCRNCYAETVAARFSRPGLPYEGLIHRRTGGWNGTIKLVPEVLDQPLRWKRPRRIFVNSMSDLFHDGVPDDYIDRVFAVMALAPQHTFQVLTKRPERMLAYMTHDREIGRVGFIEGRARQMANIPAGKTLAASWPFRNVWLGVSVENQAAADERIPLLLQCPAAVRWLSAEPLLGPICFRWKPYAHQATGESYREYLERRGGVSHLESLLGIDWVVAGGESGRHARPMSPDWARALRDQCAAADVPFLFKQWGEWLPMLGQVQGVPVRGEKANTSDGWIMGRAGKKAAGRTLDGALHDQYPETQA